MILQAIPNLEGNERKYLNECIDSTFVSSVGPFVNRFEDTLGEAVGTDGPGVSVSSGTCGLHIALHTAGVQPNDLVIIPSFTFIATANAVAHCNAQPWLHGVTKETWTLSPDQVLASLKNKTIKKDDGYYHKETDQRVAAIMPVYSMGHPPDMEAFRKIGKEFGLPIVADAAAAIGAQYKGQAIGGLADLTVFSFNGNKTITCGGGGGVVSNNKELLELVRHKSKTARIGSDYLHDTVGFNYRMTNINAAVGCAQLERLDHFVQRKKEIDQRYKEELSEISSLEFFPETDWAESARWFTGVVMPVSRLAHLKDFYSQMRERKIDVKPFWRPVHLQPPFEKAPKEDVQFCEDLWQRVIVLPCSTHLSSEDQTTVINSFKEVYGND